MKVWVWAFTCGVLLSLGAGTIPMPAMAQTTEPVLTSVVTLDPDRFFRESAFGRGVVAKIEARQRALIEENRLLTQALEAEERDLTDKRPGMTAEAFAPLATAFDQKAEGIRKAQAEKEAALETDAAGERQRFLDAATPVLRALMRDKGAQAIIDRRVIILDANSIDITAEAVARMDAEFAAIPAP
jgi:Skp family chaperone for outer membrane proteins